MSCRASELCGLYTVYPLKVRTTGGGEGERRRGCQARRPPPRGWALPDAIALYGKSTWCPAPFCVTTGVEGRVRNCRVLVFRHLAGRKSFLTVPPPLHTAPRWFSYPSHSFYFPSGPAMAPSSTPPRATRAAHRPTNVSSSAPTNSPPPATPCGGATPPISVTGKAAERTIIRSGTGPMCRTQ